MQKRVFTRKVFNFRGILNYIFVLWNLNYALFLDNSNYVFFLGNLIYVAFPREFDLGTFYGELYLCIM
jgi:hypothetical protein